ncbi:MAG TPA: ABC transporter permease [Bacteroidota bacterium]|nr:ABC transporter permease [Bacteroidota bacterium]
MNKQRILALLTKEFGQLFKDKKLLPLVFIAPVLQLTFLGFAASLDVKDISMVLCDLDKSESSRTFIEKFTNSGYFSIDYATDDYSSIQSYLDDHKTTMALVIPPKFGDDLLRHEPAKVQVILDGSEGNSTAIALGYVNQIIVSYSNQVLADVVGGQNVGGINAQVRAWFNPSLLSRNYMVPGVLVLILLITTMNLTSMAIVKEKEIGTLEQIMVTPIKPTELILGKLIPFTIIGLVNWCVVLVAMVMGFGIHVTGSIPLMFGLTAFFLLTSLGLGLFVSTISNTQQQAMMTSQFFVLQPMMYISGFTFPIENMPKVLQALSFGVPMRYYLVIVRSIILKGVGIANLWFQAGALLVMGVTVLAASVLRFKSKLE